MLPRRDGNVRPAKLGRFPAIAPCWTLMKRSGPPASHCREWRFTVESWLSASQQRGKRSIRFYLSQWSSNLRYRQLHSIGGSV